MFFAYLLYSVLRLIIEFYPNDISTFAIPNNLLFGIEQIEGLLPLLPQLESLACHVDWEGLGVFVSFLNALEANSKIVDMKSLSISTIGNSEVDFTKVEAALVEFLRNNASLRHSQLMGHVPPDTRNNNNDDIWLDVIRKGLEDNDHVTDLTLRLMKFSGMAFRDFLGSGSAPQGLKLFETDVDKSFLVLL